MISYLVSRSQVKIPFGPSLMTRSLGGGWSFQRLGFCTCDLRAEALTHSPSSGGVTQPLAEDAAGSSHVASTD